MVILADLSALNIKCCVVVAFTYTRRGQHYLIPLLLIQGSLQVFLALQSGEIRSYDLLCLKKSSYVIPNLWDMFQTKIAGNLVDPLYALPGWSVQQHLAFVL